MIYLYDLDVKILTSTTSCFLLFKEWLSIFSTLPGYER